MEETRTLAKYIVELRFEDLTVNAVAMTKNCLMDFLGCCIGGSEEPPARMMRRVMGEGGAGRGNATVFCREAYTADVFHAALCNGTAAHALDMDDVVNSCFGHPGPVVIPAALAVAEHVGASGKELITAIVAGYEAMVRIAEAVLPDSYFFWHTTSTVGAFGAAAAAGKLLNLSTEQMLHCLGSAGTQAAGLFEFLKDGANSKTLHAGKAAFNGVLSAYLSREGFTGARRILEGEKGFCRAMMKVPNLEKIGNDLGEGFRIEATSFKPYACCRWIHALINGAQLLQEEHAIQAEEIRSICLGAYPTALNITDNAEPKTVYGCKFSMQYCVAAAFVLGQVGTGAFDEEKMEDSRIRRLMSVTKTRVVKISDAPEDVNYSEIDVEMRDGTTYHKAIHYALGDPKNPMSPEAMIQKFLDLAAGIYEEKQLKVWADGIKKMESCLNVADLLAADRDSSH